VCIPAQLSSLLEMWTGVVGQMQLQKGKARKGFTYLSGRQAAGRALRTV
jgi:hypothetical protein